MPSIDWNAVQKEAIEHLQALIRIDTTNPPGNETPAAAYVAEVLRKADVHAEVLEGAPGRGNVVGRLKGTGEERPVLLLSHLDVVPAEPDRWTHPPFEGVLVDGHVWGRGSVDCKLMTVASLMTLLLCARRRMPLRRDLILAATADEETAGPANGAAYLAQHHPDRIDAEYVLNEGGGFALLIGGKRIYVAQVAEKGSCDVDLLARGRPGHSSVPHGDNAIYTLGRAIGRLEARKMPHCVTATARRFFEGASDTQDDDRAAADLRALLDPERMSGALARLPVDESTRRMFDSMLRNTAPPTMLEAGVKRNVIPSEAVVKLSGRPLPGQTREMFLGELGEIVGDEVEIVAARFEPGLEGAYDTPAFRAMENAIRAHDPEGRLVPFLVTGGTDARRLKAMDTTVYGFCPMLYEPGMGFMDLCHGHDERVSVENVLFGTRVLFDTIHGLSVHSS